MARNPATVQLSNGKTAFCWSDGERPCINHWYLLKEPGLDYWKIMKDFHDKETNITYYKIVEYYNGEILYCGKSLFQIRQLIRNNTYRMVI